MSDQKGKELTTLDSFIQENKNLGMENKSEDDLVQPYLKIIEAMTKDRDLKGQRYPDGKVLFTGTGETFDEVVMTILTYVKVETPSFKDKSIMQRQYKIAGVMGEKKLPFIMFFGGTKIGGLKKYITTIHKLGRPLFMYRVTMKPKMIDGDNGQYYVPEFLNITPIEDLGELNVLKKLTIKFREVLDTSDVYEAPERTEDIDADEVDRALNATQPWEENK